MTVAWCTYSSPDCFLAGFLECSPQPSQLRHSSSEVLWWGGLQHPAEGVAKWFESLFSICDVWKCFAMLERIAKKMYKATICINSAYDNHFVLFQAQRNNEDVEAIKPLFSVNVEHRVSNVPHLKTQSTTSVVVLTFERCLSIQTLLHVYFRVHGTVLGCPPRS